MRKYRIFTKEPWDRNSIIYYVLVIFTSCLYTALFDGPRIKTAAENLSGDAALIVASTCCCLAIFFLFALSKHVFAAFCPLLFYIGAISRFYSSELNLDTTPETAPLFFSNETVSFFISEPENGVWLAAMFLLGLFLGAVRFFAADKSAIRRGQVFAVILILAAGSSRYISETANGFIPMPAAYVHSMKEYLTGKLSRMLFAQDKTPLKAVSEKDITAHFISLDKISDI